MKEILQGLKNICEFNTFYKVGTNKTVDRLLIDEIKNYVGNVEDSSLYHQYEGFYNACTIFMSKPDFDSLVRQAVIEKRQEKQTSREIPR